MRLLYVSVFVIGFLAIGGAMAAEPAAIGIVKRVSGEVTVEQKGGPAATPVAGGDIRLNDVLVTGPDGGIGVSFDDSTTISLGANSRLAIDEFVYEPADKNVGLALRMVQGTLSYLSGKIGAIDPEKVSVETPSMTIGIRGTKFLLRVAAEKAEERKQ